MRNFGKLLLFIILTNALLSCTPVKVLDYRQGVEPKTLMAYKTFSFYQLHVTGDRGPYFATNLEVCKKAIASQMTSRGFTEVNTGGSLMINIGVLFSVKNQNGSSNEMQYLSEPDYTRSTQPESVEKLKVGTITVEMIDINKKEGVWIGAVSGVVPQNEGTKQKRINDGMAILFDKFPVKPK